MNYLQITISAEDQSQVDKILNALLERRLVTGGQIINTPARFLWKGKITDMDYYTIHSFTISMHKEEIIKVVRENSIEEVPMITFTPFDGNEELLKWIDEILNQ